MVDTNSIHTSLLSIFPDGFSWKQLNSNYPARIYPKNDTIKAAIIDELRKHGIEFNSFTNKSDRKRAYIIRGLAHGADDTFIGDIQNTLAAYGIVGDIQVRRFITAGMKRNADTASALFAVFVGPNVDDGNIYQIKKIGSFRVVIEKMNKSSVIQCHRCQRFKHTTNQCNYQFRCVQCITVHEPGKCPRKTNNNLPIGCVNCYASGSPDYCGHTANNLSRCKFYNSSINNGNDQNKTANNSTIKNASNVASTSQLSTNVKSSRFTGYNNIEGDIVANNPHITASKKKKKIISSPGPVNVIGKSIQNLEGGAGAKSKSGIKNKGSNKKKSTANNRAGHGDREVGALITALFQVLQKFA